MKSYNVLLREYLLSSNVHVHVYNIIVTTTFALHKNIIIIFSCVTHLLRNLNGNSPFPVDIDGYTPLHYAASHGHKMAVQIVSICIHVHVHVPKLL